MGKSNEKPLGEIIRQVLKHHRLEDKITETRIMSSWEHVMGTHIAKYTDRITIKKGVLTVWLRSSVLRNELGYEKTRIIRMVNEELGDPIVQELTLR